MADRNALMAGYAMPEGSAPYYGQQVMPSSALSAYQPTWRDRLATWMLPDGAASPERNRLVEGLTGSTGLGNTGLGVVDFIPGVGQALQAQEAVRSGDDRSLLMSLLPGALNAKTAAWALYDAAKGATRALSRNPHYSDLSSDFPADTTGPDVHRVAQGYNPDLIQNPTDARLAAMRNVLLASSNKAESTEAAASEALSDAGIPGIRYLDQGSRGVGEGSRNYVVFRDDIISIVKKYGIAAAASMYGMDQVSQAMGDTEKQNPLMQGY